MSVLSFDPVQTLNAMQQIPRGFFIENPCVRVPARTVWIDRGYENRLRSERIENIDHYLAQSFGFETVTLPGPFVEYRDWQRVMDRSTFFKSDSYVCHGGISHGSGRAVFIQDHQVKGVGRTQHAVLHDFYKDTNGFLGGRSAYLEICNEKLLNRLLTIKPIPNEFLLALPSKNKKLPPRFLLGRRGSPLRVSHLHYLLGVGQIYGETNRHLIWRRFLADLFNGPGEELSARVLRRRFETMIDHALITLAECRVFGIFLANWPDNGDVFSRALDCEDTRFDFVGGVRERGCDADFRRRTPMSWFLDFERNREDGILGYSLQTLKNAFLAMDSLAIGIGYDLNRRSSWLSWAALEHRYRRAILLSLGKLLGCGTRLQANQRCLTVSSLMAHFPLIPEKSSGQIFNRSHFVDGYLNGLVAEARGSGPSRNWQAGRDLGLALRKNYGTGKASNFSSRCRSYVRLLKLSPVDSLNQKTSMLSDEPEITSKLGNWLTEFQQGLDPGV